MSTCSHYKHKVLFFYNEINSFLSFVKMSLCRYVIMSAVLTRLNINMEIFNIELGKTSCGIGIPRSLLMTS